MASTSGSPLIAPGTLKMKCMIWQPNPISERTQQEYGVVYNSTTIQTLPEQIQRMLHTLDQAPYGIYLKEKYVYRDTFLKIGDEHLQTQRLGFLAENGEPLFDSSVTPAKANYPYIEHQTFRLVGSLYSNRVATPSALQQNAEAADDVSFSKWKYEERIVPFEHDGHKHDTYQDASNDHDWVAALNMQTCDDGFEATARSNINDGKQAEYMIYRKVHRFMPMQIAATSEQKGRTGNDNDSSRPIHWLCEKETPLGSGQDFFVEFVRLAYQPDIVPNSKKMLTEYSVIDATHLNVNTNGVVPNAGVVELDQNNGVVKESINTYNLSSQPYYLIEIGKGDPQHHYFIILAYNSYPIFVHVGKFGVIVPSEDPNVAPKIITPEENVSRRLSIFQNVSCKQLMDQESLRVVVRQHLGKMIVSFSGYEGTPWVISRTDFINPNPPNANSQQAEEEASCGVPLTNMDEKPVAMNIAPTKIQIGAGNMKCGFMFAPLHYEPRVTFLNPTAITVKGPVTERDINIYLGERNGFFFQDAELFIETKGGTSCSPASVTRKNSVSATPNSKWPMKALGKNTNSSDYCAYDVVNQVGEKISYIAADMATSLGASPNVTGEENNNNDEDEETEGSCSETSGDGGNQNETEAEEPIPGAGTYIKWFNARFTLSGGDMTVGGLPPNGSNSNSGGPTPPTPWRIWHSITPIATGWRLAVPPNTNGHRQRPLDAAKHVETFSHTWTYSDNVKVEHSGNIRFRVNLGTASSLTNDSSPPTTSDSTNPAADHSAYLLSLSDKTFFIRVYAWWEGGYMDCQNSSCPCRRPSGANTGGSTPDAKHCIFTGLCHGGEVTVEGNTRYMDCQLHDYMKIMQDQYFLNSPFFDGMSDYHAVKLICDLAGFSKVPQGTDVYAPGYMVDYMANQAPPNGSTRVIPYINSGESLMLTAYALPSSYDILQNPYMKFADGSKYDEALTKIGTLAGKVVFFDRFGVMRYDLRPDSLFLTNAGRQVRVPKCSFMASPHALGCGYHDLLALNQYSYKRAVGDVVNEILLATATPQGEVLVKSVLNLPGRYQATHPGYIGYTKRLLQMEGIFGSQQALETIADYYSKIVFKPPVVFSWESMGVPHLQAMDIVTFTGLNDDLGFGESNVETSVDAKNPVATLILTSVTGEIIAQRGEWRNKYEGEWLYGNVAN